MSIKEQIEKYVPYNEQEQCDKEQMLSFIDTYSDILTRKNTIGHFSSSAFVVNKDRTKVLVVYHIIQNGWIWPGGHADGDDNLLNVATREVKEETGLDVKALDENIFGIHSAGVKGHIKHGKFVSAHIHFDTMYLMEGDDTLPLVYREDESRGVKWIPIEDLTSEIMCDFTIPISKKMISKLRDIEDK